MYQDSGIQACAITVVLPEVRSIQSTITLICSVAQNQDGFKTLLCYLFFSCSHVCVVMMG